jgi:hypothetical protein
MAQEIRRQCAGKKVLYIGSAGSCYPFTAPHLVTVERVLWSPTGERYGLAQRPGWLYPPIEVNCSNSLNLPAKTVLTSTGITVSDQMSEYEGDEYVENMELYACIAPLQESAAELSIILGITNRVGSHGRQDWLKYRTIVAEMTAEAAFLSLEPKMKLHG